MNEGERKGTEVSRGGLLVLVFCLVFLIGLAAYSVFFPAERYPRARPAACLSNLKQIGLASFMYAADYNDRGLRVAEWMDLSLPYTKRAEVFHSTELGMLGYGYAYNSKLNMADTTAIVDPVTTPMVYDSSSLRVNASDPYTSSPRPFRHLDKEKKTGRNHVVYMDGHGKALSRYPGP